MITKLNSTKLKVLKENKQDKRELIMGENGEQGKYNQIIGLFPGWTLIFKKKKKYKAYSMKTGKFSI